MSKPVKTIKSSRAAKEHNPLLVKGAVGKNKPTVYDLPSEDHIYGKPVIRDPLENAVMGTFQFISFATLECKSDI
jgi:hypothetical protein